MDTIDWSTDDITKHLRSTRLFAGLDDASLNRFAEAASVCIVPAGDDVIGEGEDATDAFVVIAGRLSIIVEQPDGSRTIVNDVGTGEVVGEMALLTDDPRSATVRARRDAALLRISADDFRAIVLDHPTALMTLTRTVVQRLNQSIHSTRADPVRSVIGVMPAGSRPAHREFGQRLADALEGSVVVVTARDAEGVVGSDASPGALAQYLHRLEDRHRFIVLVGDGDDPSWKGLCFRQSDLVLHVGYSNGFGEFGEHEADLGSTDATSHLVIVHTDATPLGTNEIVRARGRLRHHHVRRGSDADVERVARIVMGTSVGVVLGGGGARGFAHLGAMRAMLEAGLPIDHIGGTSIGASVAAGYAMDFDIDHITELVKRTTSERGSILDPTLPSVALARGKRLVARMRDGYGEVEIEDLWLDFLCVSTDLSIGDAHIHRSGPVWRAVRASIAIPGVLAPMSSADGHVLVDGGILDNLPTGPMATAFDPQTIVAVDLRAPTNISSEDLPDDGVVSGWGVATRSLLPWLDQQQVPGVVESLIAASLVSGGTQGRMADLTLRPPVGEFGFMDFGASDEMVEVGYRHAVDHFEANGLPG